MQNEKCKMKNSKLKMVRLFNFAFFIFPFAFAVISGCALLPSREEAPLKQATAEELTALLQEREAAIQTMKGLFSAKIKGGILPISQRVEGAMYYRRPNVMRLQGFSAVGSELFEFVVTEDQYKLRLPTMGRTLTGRPSVPDQLGKLARPFQLSVWALNGVVGASSVGKHERVALVEEGNRYRLDVSTQEPEAGRSKVIRRIWFDRRTLLVVQEDRLSPSGDVEAVMQFDDYRFIGDDAVAVAEKTGDRVTQRLLRPFKVSMEDGQGRGSIQLTFHEIVPNAPLKPGELGHVS